MIPTKITVTEAARGFSDLINRVFYRHESALLVKGGKPMARLLPVNPPAKTGGELAARWDDTYAGDPTLADEIAKARAKAGFPRDPWA